MKQEAERWVRRVRRVRAAGVAGVVVVLGVVGCGSPEPAPEPEPVATTTEEAPEPTPEQTSTPELTTPPATVGIERPAAMDDPGDAGAIAAAEYFALMAYMALTYDVVDELQGMANESCNFCATLVESTQEFEASGNTYEGGEATLLGTSEIAGRDDTLGAVGVVVPMIVESAEERTGDGALVGSWERQEVNLYVEVVHTYLGWMVLGASHTAGIA